jgi:hypothetical protein
VLRRTKNLAAESIGHAWTEGAIAHARTRRDAPALCVALAAFADFLEPGSPDAARVFAELRALDDPDMAPLARSAASIAEAGHHGKLGDFPAAIASVQRGLTLIAETGVRNGVWIVRAWLIGFKLAAGRTADVIADGLPFLHEMQGTRNETALGICRRALVTALLAEGDLERARPLARVGWE